MEQNVKRRAFLKIIPIVAATAALGARSGLSIAQAKKDEKKDAKKGGDAKGGELPHLDEKDPQAAALGYKHDAKQVDRKKFANYQPGQTCATCQQFQAKAKEPWAP